MGRCFHNLTLMVLMALLAACGQTGPLYLPAPAVNEAPATAATPSKSEQPAASAASSESATTQE